MSEPFVRVVDFETGGLDPATADIIEVGFADVLQDGTVCHAWNMLVKSKRPIEIEAMAAHHLTNAMVENGADTATWQAALIADEPAVFVAHHAKFEASFWPDAPKPWICTYKSALRLWPDAPRHTNQVLRYWLKLDQKLSFVAGLSMPPHRAGPDAYVTAHIFARMLVGEGERRLKRMLAWTKQPGLLPKILFGKHRGSTWDIPPADYLQWLIKQPDMDEDVRFTADMELSRRRQG
jgi:exodeoxyribonuclease X